MSRRILMISDDQSGEQLRRALYHKGFDVFLTEEANAAYQQMVEDRFDLVAVNLRNANTAAGLIKRIRTNSNLKQLRVLALANWGTGLATVALSQGADAFEPRPIETERLVAAIDRLFRPAMVMIARAGSAFTDD